MFFIILVNSSRIYSATITIMLYIKLTEKKKNTLFWILRIHAFIENFLTDTRFQKILVKGYSVISSHNFGLKECPLEYFSYLRVFQTSESGITYK